MRIKVQKLHYFELRYRVRWDTLHKLFYNPVKIWRQRRQRLNYGVSKWDSYDFYSYLQPVIANGLDYLANSKTGVPVQFVNENGELTEEGIKSWEAQIARAAENARWLAEYEDKSMALYDKYFDDKLDGFNHINKGNGYVELVSKREMPERDALWREECNKLAIEREARKNELFDFMKEWFFSLWD